MATTTAIPPDFDSNVSAESVSGLLIAAVLLAVLTPCAGTIALGLNWRRQTTPRRVLQVLEVAVVIISLILAIMAQVDVGKARRAGSRLDDYLNNVTYYDPFASGLKTSNATFDLCHEPDALFCTNVGRYSSDLLSNSSIDIYTDACGPVLWAASDEDDCCLNAPAEIQMSKDRMDMAYNLMVVVTISIIIGVCDMVFTFRPLEHNASMACLCGTLWFDFAANVFLFVVLFPAVILDTSFDRAGFDESQCIARGRPELTKLLYDLEAALVDALEGSLTEIIFFSCAQLLFAAFLFLGTEATDIFEDEKNSYATSAGVTTMPSHIDTPPQHSAAEIPMQQLQQPSASTAHFVQPPSTMTVGAPEAGVPAFVQPGGPSSPPVGFAPNSAADFYAQAAAQNADA
eukprot:m.12392 g.12392  ORF g.12392 m.12392 type:complete len:401 (-) comp9939_c0_seq1:33-1235(-)